MNILKATVGVALIVFGLTILGYLIRDGRAFGEGRWCKKDTDCPSGEVCVKKSRYASAGTCRAGFRP